MNATAIVILVIGGLFYLISFFLPDGKKKEEEKITEEEIKALIDREMEAARTRIDDMVEETVNYSVEKTERALEKLSNEKIMAVDEYSETVLKKINDNHNEAVFLYDMLNDKDEKLKEEGDKLQVSKEEIKKREDELKKKAEEEAAAKKKAEEEKKKKEEEEKALLKKKENEFKPINPERLEILDGYAVPVTEAKPKKTAKPSSKSAKEDTVTVDFTAGEGRKNNNELIKKLHDEGKTNMQIAKELGLGVGEVKLVIELFANRK